MVDGLKMLCEWVHPEKVWRKQELSYRSSTKHAAQGAKYTTRKRLRKSRNRYSAMVQSCLGISERRTQVHASGEQLRRRMSTNQGLHSEGCSMMGEIDRKEEQLPTRPRSRPSWEVIRCVLARAPPARKKFLSPCAAKWTLIMYNGPYLPGILRSCE
jgi:hypothetical protein